MSKMVMSFMALIASSAMAANTYYVATSGSDSAAGSEDAPFASVTKAVAVAVEGDTIIVDDGTYTAPNTADGIQVFKSVTIKSKNGPLNTILKGGGTHRVVTLKGGAYVEGFTITGGNESAAATTLPGWGGGVLIEDAKIINCIVKGNKVNVVKNKVGYGGGGIFVSSKGGLISRCIIADNESTVSGARGGGIAILGGTLENCLIVNNKATSSGGGVYARSNNPDVNFPPTVVRNCTILNNSTTQKDGGGVFLHKNENPHYVHLYDTIVYNTQNSIDVAQEKPECENYVTNLCSSTSYGFNHIPASKEMFSDWQRGDYMPVAGSCLVDAAFGEVSTSEVDVDGNTRLVGSCMDIGAIEFQNKYKLTISSRHNDRGIVSIAGKDGNSVFVNPGEEVKVVASVLGAVPFAGWTLVKGGHFDESLLSSSEITFNVNCNVELVANFVREFNPSDSESLLSAIEEAYPGDVIIASDGDYLAPNTADGIKIFKDIVIKSQNGPKKTTLMGGGSHRVITLKNGAWVEGFTITGGNEKNLAENSKGDGGGACIYKGTLKNCIITGNNLSVKRYGGGGGVVMYEGSLVSGCIISNNVATNKDPEGGGVKMFGGILENSLVTGNAANYRGGGVCVSMNSKEPIIIRNCTIVKNTPNAKAGNGLYVIYSNAPEFRLIDTIVYGNLLSNEKDVSFYQTGTKSIVINLCSTTSYGTGFIAASDSIFSDYSGGDYSLAVGSPCIDAASGVGAAIDKDVAGNPRVQGKGMDIGAYEFVPKVGALTVQYDNSVIQSAQVSPMFGRTEDITQDITFTAPEDYYTSNNEDYYGITGWEYTIYDVNGDVMSTQTGEGRNALINYDPKNGEILFKWKTTKYYRVTANPSKEERGNVTINDSKVNTLYVLPGQEITVAAESEGVASFGGWYATKSGVLSEAQSSSTSVAFPVDCSVDLVAKFPLAIYVATNGSDENDGLSKAKPFATITNAVEVAGIGDTITVGDGEYEAPDMPDGIKVTKAVIIKSQNGPKKTIFKGGGNHRVVTMTNNAWVEGFTITGGKEKDQATIIQGYGAGVAMRESTLINCIVYGNEANSSYGRGGGGIMMQNGGLISKCIIRDNTASGKDPRGGGVRMTGGILENSLIVGNYAGYMSGGVHVETSAENAPIKIRNCTIVNNRVYVSASTANVYVSSVGCWISDTIIRKEKEGDGEISYNNGGNYVHNLCASTAFGKYIKNGKEDPTLKTLLTGDPKFKDYENGDYRLAAGSPCINNAYSEATTKTDLAGKKRVIGKAMDIGCYEFSSGFSVVVR